MPHSDDNLAGYALLGFGAGIYTFFKGFRQFRNYLLIADTPEIPIRSVPMGFVQVYGKAQGPKTVPSPVSHTPCFAYKVVIERWKQPSHNEAGGWKHHRTDVDGVEFYLADATGKVLVDTRGAELDLPQTARCEACQGASSATGVAATQQELLKYVSQADAHWAGGLFERGLNFAGPLADPTREQQRQALMGVFQNTPGSPVFLRGMMTMMAPKMKQHLESIGPQSDPNHEQARQLALQALEHPPGSPEFLEGVRRAAEMAGAANQPQKFDAILQAAAGNPAATAGLFSAADGRYRFTEYCLVPAGSYDISGTCVENPHPEDLNDRNMIVKGTSEKEFLISSKTEKQLESGLRKRAVMMIVGGAALSVICMAILLAKLGLL
jgi:hypothetical protein